MCATRCRPNKNRARLNINIIYYVISNVYQLCRNNYRIFLTQIHIASYIIETHKLNIYLFIVRYENPGVFTSAQLSEIKQANLARVMCDNGDNITQVPRDVFVKARWPEEYMSCESDDVPSVDLKIWASCCQGECG